MLGTEYSNKLNASSYMRSNFHLVIFIKVGIIILKLKSKFQNAKFHRHNFNQKWLLDNYIKLILPYNVNP